MNEENISAIAKAILNNEKRVAKLTAIKNGIAQREKAKAFV